MSHAHELLCFALHGMDQRCAGVHSLQQSLCQPYVAHGPDNAMSETQAAAEPDATEQAGAHCA